MYSRTFVWLQPNTMKHLILFFSCCLLLAACQNDPSPKTGDESKGAEQQTKAVEKNVQPVIADQPTQTAPAESAAPAASVPATTSAVSPKSHINGTNVTMRKDASVKSDKLGSFNANEAVTVLETKNVNNENEAILTKPIPLYVSESTSGQVAMTLPKGKAVVIEKYSADDNKYEVSYQAEGKGKLFANISADAVETISYSTWYRVKRASGEEGWVLGKFLKIN